MNSQPCVERAQAAQASERLSNGAPVRPSAFAHQASCSSDGRVGGDDRAADDIAVAVDELGRRVDDDVGADTRSAAGAPARGRCCRRRPARRRLSLRRRLADVGDAQQRVGRRLDPDERGLAAASASRAASRSVKSTISSSNSALVGQRLEQAPAAAIAIVRRQATRSPGFSSACSTSVIADIPVDVIDAAGAAFEVGDGVRELVARRIAAAAVIVARASSRTLRSVKLVDRTIGGVTAPKAVSQSMPARTARVAILVIAGCSREIRKVSMMTSAMARSSLRKASWP